MDCYRDISSDIENLRSQAYNLSEDLYDSVVSELDDADSSFQAENYAQAQTDLERAMAKLEVAEIVPAHNTNGGNGEDMGIIAAVLAVILIVVVVWFFKFKKPKEMPVEEEYEEFEDEL